MPIGKTSSMIIVDDSASIRAVLHTILDDLTHNQILECECGEAVLSAIEENPTQYNLIFIDLNMPNMDGVELIRHLGSHHYKGAIVIASSMDYRIIRLASEVAQKNHVRLIGSIEKPISEEKVQIALDKYRCFMERFDVPRCQLSKDELQEAIDKHQLIPYFQPKVDMQTNELKSVETLARIDRPGNQGIISPMQFIPTANKHGLINLLTIKLIERAALEYKEIKQKIQTNFTLAINLSPVQLEDLEITKIIDDAFKKLYIKPEDVVIEITEEFALINANQLENISRFRMKGYGVALDDFGTGFTNINQLLNLPFTEIKIDKSLITDIHSDYFSQVIVNTLLEITKSLDIDLVAEGIETYADFTYLNNLDDYIHLQGYLISKPKPKNEFIHWYHGWTKELKIKR